MIKLSNFSLNKVTKMPIKFGISAIASSRVTVLKNQGSKFLNENKNEEALKIFLEAKSLNPDDIEIDRRLGKIYSNLEKYNEAEKHYSIYLAENTNDDEIWIELGEAQRKSGFYQKALKSFNTAKEINPKNDLANRQILETENNILSIYSPQKAMDEKRAKASENLQTALNMAVNYLSPSFMKDLADVQIMFGKTASMGGTPNIAQYENYKKAITVSDTYIYASPQVIAAYLVHESIHAKDKDAYTSVREEQDAYEIATKFWIKHSNGVEDPEMDYAAHLYSKSPESLKNRVEEIYKMRDPSIAETSPNHPPLKKFTFSPPSKKVASQNLKTYEIIA